MVREKKKKRKTPQSEQKQKQHWRNKRTIVVTIQNNSTTMWHHHYGTADSLESYLERCVPSQCRLQSESPAGANPAGIVSDRHTTSADRAAPSPREGRLIQHTHTNTRLQMCYQSKTLRLAMREKNVTHQCQNTAVHPDHLQQ